MTRTASILIERDLKKFLLKFMGLNSEIESVLLVGAALIIAAQFIRRFSLIEHKEIIQKYLFKNLNPLFRR
jgi:hypothetical protein